MLPLSNLITSFRQHFPHGSLTADLITLHNDQYVVRATVMNQTGQPLATALSSHQQIEIAEDQAKQRALASLALGTDPTQPVEPPAEPAKPTPAPAPQLSPQPAPQPAVSPPPTATAPPPAPAPSRPDIPSLDAAAPAPAPAPDLDFPSPPDDDWDAESWGPPVTEPPAPQPAAASQPAPAQSPAAASSPAAPAADPSAPSPVTDLSDVIAQTSVELSRLGWTVQQGRQYLEQTYSKRSRQDLTDEELFSFLFYLESLPTPAP